MQPLEFRSQVNDLLRSISENMDAIFRPYSDRHGLTQLQARVLLEVKRNGGLTVGSLSRRVCIAGANASAMCKRLEQSGFLNRNRDSRDERVVHLSLTPKGLEALQLIGEALQKEFSEALAGQEDDLMVILDGLMRLDRLLGTINDAKQRDSTQEDKKVL